MITNEAISLVHVSTFKLCHEWGNLIGTCATWIVIEIIDTMIRMEICRSDLINNSDDL